MSKLPESGLSPAASIQQSWVAVAPIGTTREEIRTSQFWVHVIRKLRPLAEITVVTEDSRWYAKLLIVMVDGANLCVKELGFWELEDDVEELETSSVRVTWGGPTQQFRAVREDGVVLQHGFRTKREATLWIARNGN